jgi:hypothetical protein
VFDGAFEVADVADAVDIADDGFVDVVEAVSVAVVPDATDDFADDVLYIVSVGFGALFPLLTIVVLPFFMAGSPIHVKLAQVMRVAFA